jgi:hypothetical protein
VDAPLSINRVLGPNHPAYREFVLAHIHTQLIVKNKENVIEMSMCTATSYFDVRFVSREWTGHLLRRKEWAEPSSRPVFRIGVRYFRKAFSEAGAMKSQDSCFSHFKHVILWKALDPWARYFILHGKPYKTQSKDIWCHYATSRVCIP